MISETFTLTEEHIRLGRLGFSPNIPTDLQKGEWQMFCPNTECNFRLDKNEAASPICPNCGTRMHVANER